MWKRPGEGNAGRARPGDLESAGAQALQAAPLLERWCPWLLLARLGLTGAALMVLGVPELRTLADWLYRGAAGLGGRLSEPVNALRLQPALHC